jgi:hypothetical protein
LPSATSGLSESADAQRRDRHARSHVYKRIGPITEGKVSLRDVRFLFNAGFGGWPSFDPFRRYVAGSLHEFPTPVQTPVCTCRALLVASALVLMNVAIVALAQFARP